MSETKTEPRPPWKKIQQTKSLRKAWKQFMKGRAAVLLTIEGKR